MEDESTNQQENAMQDEDEYEESYFLVEVTAPVQRDHFTNAQSIHLENFLTSDKPTLRVGGRAYSGFKAFTSGSVLLWEQKNADRPSTESETPLTSSSSTESIPNPQLDFFGTAYKRISFAYEASEMQAKFRNFQSQQRLKQKEESQAAKKRRKPTSSRRKMAVLPELLQKLSERNQSQESSETTQANTDRQ